MAGTGPAVRLGDLRGAVALDVHPQAHERLADDARDLHLGDADARRRSRSGSGPPRSAGAAPRGRARRGPPSRRRAARASRCAASRGRRPPTASARLMSRSRRSAPRAIACGARPADWIVCSTSSNGASTASASSCTVGERPSCEVSLSRALGDLELQLLHAARHAHRPGLVAEVALDLAEHRRRRVGREAHLAVEVEAVDRLHDPDAGDLHEVVERLAAAGVAAGQRARQRQHLLRQLVAGGAVAVDVVSAQQLALARGASAPASSGAPRRDSDNAL